MKLRRQQSSSSDPGLAIDSNMSSTTDLSDGKCVVCCISTTHKCDSCQVLSYCRKDCRSKDPSQYQTAYENKLLEEKLARVASILYEAHNTFRENTWAGLLDGVEARGDTLVVRQNVSDIHAQWFTEFPHHLVASDNHAKQALLTLNKCQQAYACLHNLILKLLQGLDVDIEGVDVQLGKVPYTVITKTSKGKISSNWPGSRHCILRIRSRRTYQEWIIDLTGAQYGINQAVHTWAQYEAAFVEEVVGIYPLEFNNSVIAEHAAIEGLPTVTIGLARRAGCQLQAAVNTWELRHQSVSILLTCGDADFDRQKKNLLNCLNSAVRTFVRGTDFSFVVMAALEYECSHPGLSTKRMNAILPRLCAMYGGGA